MIIAGLERDFCAKVVCVTGIFSPGGHELCESKVKGKSNNKVSEWKSALNRMRGYGVVKENALVFAV